jgi:hypothetical protein
MKLKIQGHDVEIDKKFYPYIKLFSWRITNRKHNYAFTNVPYFLCKHQGAITSFSMHEMVYYWLGGNKKIDGYVIDHADGNCLNNKLSNLRRVPPQFNVWNRIGKTEKAYNGVFQVGKKWYALLRTKDRSYCSEAFIHKKEAAAEYNRLALLHVGSAAQLNTIFKPIGRPRKQSQSLVREVLPHE